MANFQVISTTNGAYLGSVRAKDQAAAMRIAVSIYGNFFSEDKGVRVE